MTQIYGPFITNVHATDYSTSLYQEKYKSSPKATVPLPYRVGRYSATGAVGYWNYNLMGVTETAGIIEISDLYTRTYDKFHNKAFARASLLLSMLDSRKTFTMVVQRVGQLVRALRYLKRGQLRLVVSTLGIDSHPRTPSAMERARSLVNTPSRAWLEFTFGWAPAVADIFNVVNVFQQDFPTESIKVRSAYSDSSSAPWDGGAWYSRHQSGVYYIGGDVVITNPNVLLAKQLGLTNLVSVAWDAVPFSFVVDWILPVNKFLLSLDNDFGIEIRNSYRGWGSKTVLQSGHVAHNNGALCKATGISSHRVIGAMPRPGLFDRLRVPKLDPWLAVTSLSLLSQQWQKMLR